MGVPANYNVPFVGVDFDPTGATTGTIALPLQALIFGHQSATGTFVDNEPTLALSAEDVAAKAGIGSMLHLLAIKFKEENTFTPMYIVAVPEPVGDAAIFSYAITGTATKSGTLGVYLDSVFFGVGVAVDDTDAEIVPKLVALINASPERHCFTATAVTDILTLTVNYKGVVGGQHDVRFNYYTSDVVPAGLTPAIVLTPGTASPDITAAITGQKNLWFTQMTLPFTDDINVGLLETELTRKFGVTVQKQGAGYFGKADDSSTSIAWSTDSLRNNPHMSYVDGYKYPQHPMYIAAKVCGAVTSSVGEDVGEPMHRITLSNMLPPIPSDRYDLEDLNTLTNAGICTLNPDGAGGPQTFGMVTMYLKSSSGTNDIAYRKQTTMFILMKLSYDLRNMFGTKFPRARLADDAERIKSGIQVMTPKLAKAATIDLALLWEEDGLVENLEEWQDSIIYTRDSNPDWLNGSLGPDLVNQYIVGANTIGFKL